jgi:hypothetical protein
VDRDPRVYVFELSGHENYNSEYNIPRCLPPDLCFHNSTIDTIDLPCPYNALTSLESKSRDDLLVDIWTGVERWPQGVNRVSGANMPNGSPTRFSPSSGAGTSSGVPVGRPINGSWQSRIRINEAMPRGSLDVWSVTRPKGAPVLSGTVTSRSVSRKSLPSYSTYLTRCSLPAHR